MVKLLEAYLKEKKKNNIIVKFLLRRSKDRYQSGSTFKLVELKVDKIKILSRSKYPDKKIQSKKSDSFRIINDLKRLLYE